MDPTPHTPDFAFELLAQLVDCFGADSREVRWTIHGMVISFTAGSPDWYFASFLSAAFDDGHSLPAVPDHIHDYFMMTEDSNAN